MENRELTIEELDQIMAGYPDQLVQLYSLLDNPVFANDKEKLERIKQQIEELKELEHDKNTSGISK